MVGDYLGQPAASAVQEVRRAGLRPGLDRSFGCEADLIGLTVAQDPPPGSEIARNGLVTLYVAAAGAPVEPDGERGDRAQGAAEETTQAASPASDLLDAFALARRRRKPGRAAAHEQQRFDVAPEPTLTASDGNVWDAPVSAETGRDEQNDEPSPQAAQTWAAETAEVPRGAQHEAPYETLLAEDLFAAHAGEQAVWGRRHRRDAASRAWQGALSWARGHPVLATCVCAVLAVWVAVALAGSLAGPRTSGAGKAVPSASGAPGRTLPRPTPARKLATVQPRPPNNMLERDTHTAERYGQRATPRQVEATAAPPEGANTAAQPEPQRAPAASARPSRVPAPAPAQTGGGPFSP